MRSLDAGVFILGMHRSGTSAATRLVNLPGPAVRREDELVPPSEKNPKGYWESMSLVAINERLLRAIGSDMSCPLPFRDGWDDDARLDHLRDEARRTFAWTFPAAPWVWKDPRNCLTLTFWRRLLDVRPVVVLVNRNPLEIVASSLRAARGDGKIYALALWERYVREALDQIGSLPVLVTSYDDLLEAPLAWCELAGTFLTRSGIDAAAAREADVLSFVDPQLRRAASSRDRFLGDPDVSESQRELFLALERQRGLHDVYAPPLLPAETVTTEALLAERRRSVAAKLELSRLQRLERRRRWFALRQS